MSKTRGDRFNRETSNSLSYTYECFQVDNNMYESYFKSGGMEYAKDH